MENEARGQRLELHMDLGNDAFQADLNGEIARVLRDLAKGVLEGIMDSGKVNLKDTNGNTVGSAELIGVRGEEEAVAGDASTVDNDDEDEELSVTKAMESDDPFVNVSKIAQLITRGMSPESLEEAKKRKKLRKVKKIKKGR